MPSPREKIAARRKRADDAGRDLDQYEEEHEAGTPRQNKRQCIHIDPITKQPKHPEGHAD